MRPVTLAAVLAALVLTVPGAASAADPAPTSDQDRDRDQDRLHQEDMDQLKTHLLKKIKLADADVAALEPELKRYFRLHGEQAHVRTMLQAGVDAGCVGSCMQEMVRATNRAMVWGMQDKEAGILVAECLQDRIRDRDRTGAKWSDADLADQLHDRVRDRLQIWERDHDRLLDRERDHDRDRDMQREQDRASERASAMNGRGGGR